MWYVLHMAPVHFARKKCDDPVKDVMGVLNEMAELIPCVSCKMHMKVFQLTTPVMHPGDLSKWMNALHNSVNSRLGKQTYDYLESFAWCSRVICGSSSKKDAEKAGPGWLTCFVTR